MEKISRNANIQLTVGQQRALDELIRFISNDKRIFVLKGYAGTGKTTLMKELLAHLERKKCPFSLWASTGRAAKILSNVTNFKAETVHSGIYKYTDFNQDIEEISKQRERDRVDKSGQLFLRFELSPKERKEQTKPHFYIVDEASMISDQQDTTAVQAVFGSGRLLKDMLDYDPYGKFVFVGDICQLPPVIQSFSPALSVDYFEKEYRLSASSVELTQIMRQVGDNDIIKASQKVRNLYHSVPKVKWGALPLRGYKNITLYPDTIALTNAYVKMVKEKGYNVASLICRSNKRTNELTEILRPAMGKSGNLQKGDLLLVTQNNYITGLMNGDMVVVETIDDHTISRAGLYFRKVQVRELFTNKVYSQLLLEDVIYSNTPNLNAEQQKELFIDFFMRMKKKGIRQKHPMFTEMMFLDPYLNALRTSYGYALTCHKAQGGEWDHIFLDYPRNLTLNPTQAMYQWVYTAMTRAKLRLHIVDDFFIQ